MMKIIIIVATLISTCLQGVHSQSSQNPTDTCHVKLSDFHEPLEGINDLLLDNCELFLSTSIHMVFVDLSDSIVLEFIDEDGFGKKGYFLDIMDVTKIPGKKDHFEIKAHVSVQPNPCYFELVTRKEWGELKIESLVFTHTEI